MLFFLSEQEPPFWKPQKASEAEDLWQPLTGVTQQTLKPDPCDMPATSENKTCAALFGKLRCRSCTASCVIGCFCRAEVVCTKSCAAANEKLHCDIEKVHCRNGTLSCPFTADFRPTHLGSHVPLGLSVIVSYAPMVSTQILFTEYLDLRFRRARTGHKNPPRPENTFKKIQRQYKIPHAGMGPE